MKNVPLDTEGCLLTLEEHEELNLNLVFLGQCGYKYH